MAASFPVFLPTSDSEMLGWQKSIIARVQNNESRELEEELNQRRIIDYDVLGMALREAADKGHLLCAQILLDHKSLPNQHDANGFTPTIIASRRGHTCILKLLIKHGANINKPSFRIRATALHWAATNGHYGCCRTLIAAGANIEAVTVHSRTPLMLAARSDQTNIMDLLVEHGANIHATDYELATALHLAAEEGASDCVWSLLHTNISVNTQTRTGDTPLMKAARGGHAEVLKYMIRHGADITLRGPCMTAAHWAAEGGHSGCLMVLLDAGCDPDVLTEETFCTTDFLISSHVTPLMLAARRGYCYVMKQLLDAGAVIDRVDPDGMTALLYAIHDNKPACVAELIRLGANPNGVPLAPDSFFNDSSDYEEFNDPDNDDDEEEEPDGQAERGISPLFMAIKRKSYNVLFVLLRVGCSVSVIGHTLQGAPVGPLEYALSLGDVAAMYALLLAGAGASMINPQVTQMSLARLMTSDEDVVVDIVERLARPTSLKDACRFAIRKQMEGGLDGLPQLPLPTFLRGFLDFHEFEALAPKSNV